MKLIDFKCRNLTIDSKEYEFSLDYPAKELSKTEKLKFTKFVVYNSTDVKKYRFIAIGEYTKNNVNKNFELCIEEFDEIDYNTSFIEKIFFNNRNTIVMLVQGYFNNVITPVKEDISTETTVVQINEEFTDTFVREEAPTLIENKTTVKQQEPVILIEKLKPSVKSKVKPRTTKKKPIKKKATTK